jgi:hypothetical protein
MNLSATDERLLHRFLDGALTEPEAAACRARPRRMRHSTRAGWQQQRACDCGQLARRVGQVAAPAGLHRFACSRRRGAPLREQPGARIERVAEQGDRL